MNKTVHPVLLSIGVSALTALIVSIAFLNAMGRMASAVTPAASSGSLITPQPTAGIFSPTVDIPATIQRTDPAVVSVIITKNVPVMQQYFEESPFGGFAIPRYRSNGTRPQEIGGGTAFFVSSEGLLLTNKHVVDDPSASYTVFLNDGRRLEATVVGLDPTNDIALLKVNGNDFPYLHLNAESPAVLGQTVIAIGNALGEFRNTVSVGVISGLERSIIAGSLRSGEVEQLSGIIQTDAAINEGNSGGPLLDIVGNVVGMNTAVASEAQNIGFAIPATDLKRVLDSYQQYGRIVRPYLGVRYTPMTKALQDQLKLPYDYGMYVSRGAADEPAIIPGSPAEKAGIVENDILLEADGKKLTQDNSLSDVIQGKLPGNTVEIKVWHQGQEKTITVTLEEWKTNASSSS